MLRRRFPLSALALGLFFLLPACGTSRLAAPPSSEELIDVTVSIVPQKYFLERIGGDRVKVSVMVGPGFNPTTYEPKPSQIQELSVTQIYIRVGVPFEEAWMDRIAAANEHMVIVDQSEGIERLGGTDPHIWLSPQLAKIQAQTICDGLVEMDPDNEGFYQANLGSLLFEIDELDASIRDTLAGLESRKLMVFHPAWSYFARDYDLEMIPAQIEGGDPSAAEMADLIRAAKQHKIKVIFAQPEFSTRSAKTIADEIGGEVLLISPLAPDWLDNLQRVADTFSEVLAREQ